MSLIVIGGHCINQKREIPIRNVRMNKRMLATILVSELNLYAD